MLDNYNERLFNGKSVRSKLHIARYTWLQKKIKQYNCPINSVLELGCFDGKTLDFLGGMPNYYEGYDANWENGLDLGKEIWKKHSNYKFKLCTQVQHFTPAENSFDISVCQETAEHLPIQDLDLYLERLAKATKQYCFISVPNERGIVFLVKHLLKFLTQEQKERENVSLKEVYYSIIGKLNKIERSVRYHKGFDYIEFKQGLLKHFDIVETNGIPFPFLPVVLNFTVCFICKPKKTT